MFLSMNKNRVQKLNKTFRGLAGFVFVCGTFAAFGLAYGLSIDGIDAFLLFPALASFVGLYVSGYILFTGYTPSFLLFAHRVRNLPPLPDELVYHRNRDVGPFGIKICNDNVTSMQFVVDVLKNYIGLDQQQAAESLLNIHENGSEVFLETTQETAEKLAEKISNESKFQNFPLEVLVVNRE